MDTRSESSDEQEAGAEEGEEEGEGVRGKGEEKEFLMKWKGYRERTWEKEAYLKGAEQRVREFFRWKRRNEKRRERRAE